MKKMTRKKIRRCNRRFFTAYGVLLVIAVLAVVFGYSYIRTYLTEYESVQTKYVADESFRMFRDLDYAALYACEKPENQALTDVQGYEAHASALLSGKEITYRDSYTGTEEEKIYNVYADGKRFATFSIRLSGETTSRGLEKWTYSGASINLLENAFRQFRVECYEGSRVFVDGVEIMEDQMTVIGELQGYEGHLKKGVELPKQYEFTISDRLTPPVVTVLDAQGAEQTVEMDVNGVFCIDYPYQDAQMKGDREEWIMQTAMSISKYTLGHASLQNIGQRVDPSSVAYQYISKIDTSIIFNHYDYKFEKVVTENYCQFSEDCFSVDVHYDFVVYYYEKTRVYETSYRFFFHKVNGMWMLYDFMTI